MQKKLEYPPGMRPGLNKKKIKKILVKRICIFTGQLTEKNICKSISYNRYQPAGFCGWKQGPRIDSFQQVFFQFYREGYDSILVPILIPFSANRNKSPLLSRLLKCFRSLYGKQCGPRSDCSYRSSLFWVYAVCFYT